MPRAETRPFFHPNPGRKDIYGVEWWRTDGTSDWYRWENGRLFIKRFPEWQIVSDRPFVVNAKIVDLCAPRLREEFYNDNDTCAHVTEYRWSGIGCYKCSAWFCR